MEEKQDKGGESKFLDDKVKHLQLVNAVSSNDIDAVLNAIFKINSSPSPQGGSNTALYGSPLHLVVSLCQTSVVQNVLNVFCNQDGPNAASGKSLGWINAQNSPDRETPLHIASKLARLDVLELLFHIPNVNDTIRDANGATPANCAPNDSVAAIFDEYQTEFSQMLIAAMKNAAECGDHNGLDSLFEKNERAQCYLRQGWVDINGPMESSYERSLLHLAAKADNIELLVWALKYGADPNVTDRRGKKPIDYAKAERIKEILKHAKTQTPILSSSLAQATSTTVTSPSKGPIPSLGAKEPPVLKGIMSKWTNYKDGYQARYFVLESGVLSYYHGINDYPAVCRGSISTLSADTSFPDSNDLSRFDVTGTGNIKYSLKCRSPADAKKWVWALKESRMWLADSSKAGGVVHSRKSSSVTGERPHVHNGMNLFQQGPVLLPIVPSASSEDVRENSARDSEEKDKSSYDLYSFLDTTSNQEIQNPEMRRFLTLLKTEMEVQRDTVKSAVDLLNQASVNNQSTSSTLNKLPVILNDSAQHIESLILGIVRYCIKREGQWENKLAQANETHRRLEEIVRQAASNSIFLTEAQSDARPPIISVPSEVMAPKPLLVIKNNKSSSYLSSEEEDDDDEFYDAQEGSASPGKSSPGKSSPGKLVPQLPLVEANSTMADEECPVSPTVANIKYCSIADLKESSKGYESIIPHRSRLPLDPSLPKPSLQVWSFLKNAIGKDLSKVPLPVVFNEPVSMLQRMCEDIEFIELLSLASRVGSFGASPTANHPNQPAKLIAKRLKLDYSRLESLEGSDASLFRLMFVGAFAMSNYSSTAGRTSKPFNPLLGETYELIQMEKHCRYLSEQVCHHPPVSACYCDSPDYSFWTEVYVKSKFWGKSLELQPLGNCHVSLPVYDSTGKATTSEHYSWKKVTTCVNNLILGPLSIEHYGDMVVKNHRTGEQMVITFKPKDPGGWFVASKDAPGFGGDISGFVKDSKGVPRFELKGRWDEYLSAIPISKNSYTSEAIELWRVHPRPEISPQNFNLTDFSLILNQTSPQLDKCLPLTDSRKRPDQRAMEEGRWDEADKTKEKCEVNQRVRRKRIVGVYDKTGVPYGPPSKGLEFGEKWWTPRWFIREIEADTNEGHWKFSGDYWKLRSDVMEKNQKWPPYIDDLFGITADSEGASK